MERIKCIITRRVIICEVIAFSAIILLLWLDEILDIPHVLLGAEKTPVNLTESVFESILIIMVAGVVVYFTLRLLHEIRVLGGILPVCISCKKIRSKEGEWVPFEIYVKNRSEAEFSHSICPECTEKLYPEYCDQKK